MCGSILQPVFGLSLSCSGLILSSTKPGDSEKRNLTLCPISAVGCFLLMYWCMCKNNYRNYASQRDVIYMTLQQMLHYFHNSNL